MFAYTFDVVDQVKGREMRRASLRATISEGNFDGFARLAPGARCRKVSMVVLPLMSFSRSNTMNA